MSVDRSVPTPPPTVTGQSPRESGVMVVPDEWVDAAENAVAASVPDGTLTEVGVERVANAVLRAVLPLIEGRVREECAQEIEAMLPACSVCGVEYVEDAELGARCSEWVDAAATRRCAGHVALDELSIAARLREGGRT